MPVQESLETSWMHHLCHGHLHILHYFQLPGNYFCDIFTNKTLWLLLKFLQLSRTRRSILVDLQCESCGRFQLLLWSVVHGISILWRFFGISQRRLPRIESLTQTFMRNLMPKKRINCVYYSLTYLNLRFIIYISCHFITFYFLFLNECPGYDTKQSDGEVTAVLELWGMRSTPSLPSLPGPLWPGVVVPDRVLSMGQIELTAYLC